MSRAHMPSDNLTAKQQEELSGPCRSYDLSKPMGYGAFRQLPDDLKIEYIKGIRDRYHVTWDQICDDLLHCSRPILRRELMAAGYSDGRKFCSDNNRYKSFVAWAKGEENAEGQLKMAEPEEPMQEVPRGVVARYAAPYEENAADWEKLYRMEQERCEAIIAQQMEADARAEALLDENRILRAKLEVVELIFGGTREKRREE